MGACWGAWGAQHGSNVCAAWVRCLLEGPPAQGGQRAALPLPRPQTAARRQRAAGGQGRAAAETEKGGGRAGSRVEAGGAGGRVAYARLEQLLVLVLEILLLRAQLREGERHGSSIIE